MFEKKFNKDYLFYLRNVAERLETPFSVIQDIRKKIQSEMSVDDPLAVL
jgi:hypothetical protein